MKSTIVDWWIHIRASYWFVPSLMAVAAVVASFVAVHLDTQFGDAWLSDYPWLYATQPAGARALLSTVAGSMITVAGVTFSMTLLAVSHASAQIGPRLLAGFMRDRGNQFTLGTFIATFLYCLMVLRTVHAGTDGAPEQTISVFVPHFAILLAVALAILSVAVLIYFIHHVPQTISIANVIAGVGAELVQGVQSMYPQQIGQALPAESIPIGEPKNVTETGCDICVGGDGGYLRVLDTDGLLRLATENELLIKPHLRPGDFAVAGQPLLRVWSTERVDEELECALQNLFSWGTERTREQDLMFPAEQLIEVLGKAMSPGVNGQYTAVLCLNQFERAFAELLQRHVPDTDRYDEQENLRVIARPISHEDFLVGVLRPVRQFIRDDWITTNHLLKMLKRLVTMPNLRGAVPLLTKEVEEILQDAECSSMAASEKALLLAITNE